MSRRIPVFRSPESEAEYNAAYEAALKLWPVPYEELFVPTRFGDTHVIASGSKDAPPLLLLHPSGCGATIWYRNIGPLSQRYRTFALDTISEVNKSVLIRPIRDRQDFVYWMLDLLNCLQIERAHMVGNSFGGFLALNTALALPERVNKIVLISPAATFVQMWAWIWHFIPTMTIGSAIGSKRLLQMPFDWIWQDFPKDECISHLRAITATAGMPRHGPPSVFADEELRRLTSPVLLLIGDHEVIYRPEAAIARATRLVVNLTAEMIPNANHNAEYTAPAAVNEKVLSFLSG